MAKRLIVFAALFAALGLAPWLVAGDATVGEQAPDFWLKDQYDNFFKLSDLRGTVVLMVYGDRTGAQFNGKWATAVREKYNAGGNEQARIVPIANLDAVPRPFRSYAKGKFRGNNPDGKPSRSVLLDWDGGVAKLYGFQEGLSNVYLVDRNGALRYSTAGKGSPGEVDLLCRTISRVLSGK